MEWWWWWYVHFVVNQHAWLDFYIVSSLKQQSVCKHIALHSDTLYRCRANQSLLFLLRAARLVENNKYQLYCLWFDFNFLIVNFPFICTCSNIPAAPVYGVYLSQVIRYSRACGSYQDFLDRGMLLTRKLLNQGFLLVKLKSSLRKFYGRHHDLIDRYGISVSQMTTDMFHLS
jgi:hypothetical protein